MGFLINEAALPITFCESVKPIRSRMVETLGSISWRVKRQADKRKPGGGAATPT